MEVLMFYFVFFCSCIVLKYPNSKFNIIPYLLSYYIIITLHMTGILYDIKLCNINSDVAFTYMSDSRNFEMYTTKIPRVPLSEKLRI